MNRTFLALALVTASTSIAAADRTPAQQAGDVLRDYVAAIERLEHDPLLTTKLTTEGCKKVIDTARAAGVSDDTKLDVSVEIGKKLTLGETPALCARFSHAFLISQAASVMNEAGGWLQWYSDIDIASNHEENQEKLVASAARCDSELTRLLAAGVDPELVVKIGRDSEKVKITEAKTKLCEPLAKIAKTFAKTVEAERKARYERAAKPYKAVGINGDKLDFIINNEDSIRGVGGRALASPKELKAAKIMFVTTSDSNDFYSVTRYVFSGDRMASSTTKRYDREPGAGAYR
jgi:hypothetical protein